MIFAQIVQTFFQVLHNWCKVFHHVLQLMYKLFLSVLAFCVNDFCFSSRCG